MIIAQAIAETGVLSHDAVMEVLAKGLCDRFTGQKVLVLIPDHTRSLPLPELFRMVVEDLRDVRELNVMVALGTHPGYSEEGLNHLVGITAEERATTFKHVGLLNHAWDDPAALTSLGVINQDEIKQLAGPSYHSSLPNEINIRINKAVLEHDQIIIVGPTFPHEVVGFSGGAKYLFPGVSGGELLHFFHWLGAVITCARIIGRKETPVRRVIHAAMSKVARPVHCAALVVDGEAALRGMFVGDAVEAWAQAADLSAQLHVRTVARPFATVLGQASARYDELWTAGKVMYKLEQIVADGGELIIHAPHVGRLSRTWGAEIERIGYHVRDYFLAQPERFAGIPRGVLAHSTHVRGAGRFEQGVEPPRIRVTLATSIPRDVCERVNLGYADPSGIDPARHQGREAEGVLVVPDAGEVLYRLGGRDRGG
jgi:nickel-dependent lactate racemase